VNSACYRISGESISTRRRGAGDQAAARDFALAESGPGFLRGIYIVHGVNVKRNPAGRDLNQ
jgi:hypothetical protein